MNLYLFNDNNIASVFGIGTYIRELVSALESSDIHIHIIHLHSNRSKFEIEKTNGIELNSVENWYIPKVCDGSISFNSIQNIEDYCRNVLYFLRLYIPEDTKDLIFHFNYNQYQWLAKELKTVFDCKTVTTLHFIKWQLEMNGNLSRFRSLRSKTKDQMNSLEQSLFITDEYETLLFKEVDKVIVLSQDMKIFLCNENKIKPDKIVVIPNGLTDTNLVQVNTKANLRKKWHFTANEFLILFAGRLHTVKGLLYLIRAFRKVLTTIPNCRLIIAGNGNFDTYLQEAKETCTKIIFTGLLKKNDLYELYKVADIGVVPSLYEPFGYVAVEMMMHEMPVVATMTSGLNEVMDNTCGIKIPIKELPDIKAIDIDLLAEKIIYLLQNPIEAKLLGKNARKRYQEKYSIPIFRDNMLDFYSFLFQDK